MTQIAIFEQFTGLTVDRQIKAVIGMGRDKFEQLAPVFSASYATIQQERLLNKEIKKLPWGAEIRYWIRRRNSSFSRSSTSKPIRLLMC